MDSYQLGRDIQSILVRLDKIEASIAGPNDHPCGSINQQQEVTFTGFQTTSAPKALIKDNRTDYKAYYFGNATVLSVTAHNFWLLVYSDGGWSFHVDNLHNGSRHRRCQIKLMVYGVGPSGAIVFQHERTHRRGRNSGGRVDEGAVYADPGIRDLWAEIERNEVDMHGVIDAACR
jgi:hypothetical protein